MGKNVVPKEQQMGSVGLGFECCNVSSGLGQLCSMHTSDSSPDHHVYHTRMLIQHFVLKHAPYVSLHCSVPMSLLLAGYPFFFCHLLTKYGFISRLVILGE